MFACKIILFISIEYLCVCVCLTTEILVFSAEDVKCKMEYLANCTSNWDRRRMRDLCVCAWIWVYTCEMLPTHGGWRHDLLRINSVFAYRACNAKNDSFPVAGCADAMAQHLLCISFCFSWTSWSALDTLRRKSVCTECNRSNRSMGTARRSWSLTLFQRNEKLNWKTYSAGERHDITRHLLLFALGTAISRVVQHFVALFVHRIGIFQIALTILGAFAAFRLTRSPRTPFSVIAIGSSGCRNNQMDQATWLCGNQWN